MATDLTQIAVNGYQAEAGNKSPRFTSRVLDMAWQLGAWFARNGCPMPRDVRVSMGYRVHANDMLFDCNNTPNIGLTSRFRRIDVNTSTEEQQALRTMAIAIYSAFFMEGLRDSDYAAVLARWGSGCVELVDEMIGYAPFLNDLVVAAEAVRCNELSHPGVLVYDVCSPFGHWFGQQVLERPDSCPTPADCNVWLKRETVAFFSQLEDPDVIAKIKLAVDAVLP